MALEQFALFPLPHQFPRRLFFTTVAKGEVLIVPFNFLMLVILGTVDH